MKILFLADLHLGSSDRLSRLNPETGLSTRLEDFLATFDQIIDYAVEPTNEISLLVIAGDIYKTRQPTNTQQSEFAKRLKRLSDAGVHIRLVDGNHDILVSHGSAATSEIYQSLEVPHVEVKSAPAAESHDDVHILYMPYAHKGKLGIETNQALIEWYCQRVRKFVKYADEHNARIKIVIGHQTLEGTTLLSGIRDIEKTSELIVPLDTFEGTNFVLYGHIHKHQVLREAAPYVVIPGSPDTIDFAESEERKGFMVYDTDTDQAQRIALSTKPLVQVDIAFDGTEAPETLTDITISRIRDIPNLSQTIVKTTIAVPETVASHIDLVQIGRVLEEASFALRPALNVQRVRRIRNKEITESLPVEDTLRKYFEKREDVQDILDELVLSGRTIIATSQQG